MLKRIEKIAAYQQIIVELAVLKGKFVSSDGDKVKEKIVYEIERFMYEMEIKLKAEERALKYE